MTTSRAWPLLKGLGALLALAVAIVGVPVVLEFVAGNPIPDALPSWSQIGTSLTSRDDGTQLLGLLKYAAWAGWALFVLSVVADVITRLRGLPTPRLGPQQHLATQLVGAVLALAFSVPTAVPATAHPMQTVSASQSDAASPAERRGALASNLAQDDDTGQQQHFEEYRVRRGDCLWDIAWNELGEPERWPEIFDASRSIGQPDGRHLADPDLIVTGWVLHIPAPPGHLPTHDRGATHRGGSDSPAADDTRTLPAPDPAGDSVVTPLRGRSRRAAAYFIAETRAETSKVATALNTPAVPGQYLSPLEVRWNTQLEEHDVAASSPRDWRRHLIREGD